MTAKSYDWPLANENGSSLSDIFLTLRTNLCPSETSPASRTRTVLSSLILPTDADRSFAFCSGDFDGGGSGIPACCAAVGARFPDAGGLEPGGGAPRGPAVVLN